MPTPRTPAERRVAIERPRRAGRADDLTLTALYEEHRSEILGFLFRMTRDREAAEDILQEIFISLIGEARAGRMPDRIRPWLYRTASNAAISRSRRRATLARLLPRLVDRREPIRPEGETLRVERDTELHIALAALAPDGRAALLLAAHGFAGSEIATSIGRTEGATRTLMCRARVQLRQLLDAAEGQA